MNLMTIKLLVLLACLAHLVLWRCDWVITCLRGGRFDFQYMKDNEKLSDVMAGTPLRQPMFSIMTGAFAMTAAFPGYLALGKWMRQFSGVYAVLMLTGSILLFSL